MPQIARNLIFAVFFLFLENRIPKFQWLGPDRSHARAGARGGAWPGWTSGGRGSTLVES